MRYFLGPIVVSVIVLLVVLFLGGFAALITATLLSILEITLSFDNAVVNARVLEHMSPRWQKRFLTWGMVLAVFGTRLVLPVLIVAASAWLSPLIVAHAALYAPGEYAHLLHNARHAIYAFGATFLLMVSLKYFFDETKTVHWLSVIEKHVSSWGRIEALEIALALSVLVGVSFHVPDIERATVLMAGIVGIGLFIVMQGIAGAFSVETSTMASRGLALFVYLNILDAAFSLDSVVGAFALSTSIPVIVAGLGIGAYFVRSLTIYFVRTGTLDTLIYLEHGAHWAILGLAGSMFAGLLFSVPELITGTIGLAFVIGAYYSSLRARARITTHA